MNANDYDLAGISLYDVDKGIPVSFKEDFFICNFNIFNRT